MTEKLTLEALNELQTADLANIAGVGLPKKDISFGANFLKLLRDVLVERIEYDDATDEDAVFEMADSCVPVYTSHLWAAFVDLALWQEDDDELDGAEGMEGMARLIMFRVAERLLNELIERYEDDADEDDDAE